jgi:hypothetical protein
VSDLLELRQEAEDALAHVWFIASLEEEETAVCEAAEAELPQDSPAVIYLLAHGS